MIKRTANSREGYTPASKQTASPNFYPVDSAIMIEDTTQNILMAVMNDRSEAGSAYKNGRIELNINRRTANDDGLGMWESLVDNDSQGNAQSVYASYYL